MEIEEKKQVFSEFEEIQPASDEEVAKVSERLIEKNLEAYKELAK